MVAELNISHIIHKLNFGPAVPGADSPLDNFVRIIPEGHRSGTYKYFLKARSTAWSGCVTCCGSDVPCCVCSLCRRSSVA